MMNISNKIAFAHDYVRRGAALTMTGLLVVAISISDAACSLFDSAPVAGKIVVQTSAAKTLDPYMIAATIELDIIVWTQPH